MTVEKNLIRCVYFPPECLTSVIVFCMTLIFETRLVVCHCKNEACPCDVLSKKWWKLRAGYPGSTSLLNLAKLKNKVDYKESSPAPGPAACPSP